MNAPRKRRAFSLLELLAVVTILGIIAAMVIPRISTSTDNAKQSVNKGNIAEINAAVERFYVDTGNWPANDLSDMEPPGTYDYFPDGLPANPIDAAVPYVIDGTTHRVPVPFPPAP